MKRDIVGALPIFEKTQIVLINNLKGNFILPKGGLKNNELPYECAAREAFEEAGVIGNVEKESFINSKKGEYFKIEVTRLAQVYDEYERRKRLVIDIENALNEASVPEYVKEILRKAKELNYF